MTAYGPGALEVAVNNSVVATFLKGIKATAQPRVLNPTGLLHSIWKARAGNLDLPTNVEPGSCYGMAVLHLLHRVVEAKAGGTVIVLPDDNLDSVALKYQVTSSSLRDAVAGYWAAHAEKVESEAALLSAGKLPMTGEHEQAYRRAAWNAYTALWNFPPVQTHFRDMLAVVGRLAAVDGALVLSADLSVLGFGGMFPWGDGSVPAKQATDLDGSGTEIWDAARHGSRHRSAAWFCHKRPGAVAFVVSEDGPVSCMVRPVGQADVLVWRPIELIWGQWQ